jgi:predicted peptidase
MNHHLPVWMLGLMALIGCVPEIGPAKNNSSLPVTPNTADDLEPGVHDQSVVSKSGDIVRYSISIPEGYRSDQPTPLIVALHFGGRVTPHFARGIVEALVLPGLGQLNAIIVAPDSIAGPWTNEKNEKMVLELMDHINQQFNIDHTKTLLTGFSMGGHGTWYIGSRNQGRFSAMIPVAGAPKVEQDVSWTTPIYVLHSRADDVVPIKATEEYVTAQKANGNQQIEFVAVDDLPHYQTGSFSVPLKNAVPWVRKIWDSNAGQD